MPFDAATLHALEYQGRRMHAALHDGVPDRKEAKLIQQRVDDILDRRPRPLAVAPDGEVIWSDASHFVLGQVEGVIVNATGQAEVVIGAELQNSYGSTEEPGEPGNDGGVGLADRP